MYCHDEDGVEGILVEYGSAFINDDTFYDWALSVYQELNGRNEERYKRWVAMSVEGYIEVWYNFRLSEDKFRDFISSLDMEQLQDIRNMFHNGNYEFMEPFIPK